MEQEKNKEAETPAEASTEPESKMKEQENKNKSDTPVDASMKPDSKKKETEASTGPESSRKKTPKSLKAESKITKKPLGSNFLNSRKDKGGPHAQWKRRKQNRRVLKGNIESSNNGEDIKNLKSREEGIEKNIINEEHRDKSHQLEKNQERIIELETRKQEQGNKGSHGMSDSRTKSQKNKEKHDGMEKSLHDKKNKEKLGGLIFMCNAKTKPDCFRYRVMGVTTSKKDVVMGVKPGLKLFLYDFDLRLLYGTYKASSSGGMKLEPRAFSGAFPVQVRFSIEKDCLPLPEGVFKKAIKENYDEKHKFKTELTVQQARNLEKLFRPTEVRPTALPVCYPQVARVSDRKVHERVREAWPHHHKETLARDPFTNSDSSRYQFLSNERDHQRIAYRDTTTLPREEIPRDFYLAEKENRAYGPQGEHLPRQPDHLYMNAVSAQRETVRTDPLYLNETDHLYMDAVSAQRETVRTDPLYLNETEYHAYGLGERRETPFTVPVATATSATALGSYTKDPYYPYHYGASSGEPYLPPLRREEVPLGSYPISGTRPIESAHLRRTETDQLGSLYSVADALLHNNQMQHYQAAQPEAATAPVSSRYSFDGLSFSYR